MAKLVFISNLKEESVVSFLMLAGKVFHNFAPSQPKEVWFLVSPCTRDLNKICVPSVIAVGYHLKIRIRLEDKLVQDYLDT